MFRLRGFSNLVLAVAASLVVVGGLLATDASANSRTKVRVVHRTPAQVTVVTRRPVSHAPRVWTAHRPAPRWSADGRYVVVEGNPYWFDVGIGAYFGGLDVDVQLGNVAPRGYGYWDPYAGAWVRDVRAYTVQCHRLGRVPALEVVRVQHTWHRR